MKATKDCQKQRLFNTIKTPFLNKEIPRSKIKNVIKPILTHTCESWTTNEKQRSKINGMKMRYARKFKIKPELDTITNGTYRQEFKVEPIDVTTQ